MNEFKIGTKTIPIKNQWKIGFFATWIAGLLAHAYRFFNFLPTWDTMYNFTGTGATFYSGRCFLGFFSGLSSKYDMSWVNGALSLLYMSIAVVMLIEIFEIEERLSCILLAFLVASFPTVTSTFAYMFTADGYMIAFLLSIMGVYLTKRFKHGIWLGMVCIGLSMGTYQAYISVTLVTIILIVILDLLLKKMSFKAMFLQDWKYLPLVIGGAVFYKIVSSIINAYYGIVLTGYQGIDSMGIMTLEQYKEAFYKTCRELAHLLCLSDGLRSGKYSYANIAVFAGIILGTVILIIKNKTYKNISGVIVTIFAILILPMAAFSVNFVSPGVSYHTLMEMGVCFIYILLLLYIEHGHWTKLAGKALKTVGILVLAFLAYFNTINANIAYTQMNLSYEKSYGIAGNLLDRIEQLDAYPEVSRVAIIGSYHAYSGGIDDLTPAIMGVSQDTFLDYNYHYSSMWNYCFGVSLAVAEGEEVEAIKETDEYKEMTCYPAKDSVKAINGIIVIKLSE